MHSRPNRGAHAAKLARDQVVSIRRAYIAGDKLKDIAAAHGCSKSNVGAIVFGRQYAWVPGAVPLSAKRSSGGAA